MTKWPTSLLALLGFFVMLAGCASLPGLADDVEKIGNSKNQEAANEQKEVGALADQPTGGQNTLSFSVANCFNCPLVNVMIDPDGYWQRSEAGGVITGQADPNLYKAMVHSFASGGLYTWPPRVVIMPAFKENCPNYRGEGQVFFLSLSLQGERRQTYFDAGCAGSDYAYRAVDAVNAISQIKPFQDILSGQVDTTKVPSPEAKAVPTPTDESSRKSVSGFPLPPSLKPWGG